MGKPFPDLMEYYARGFPFARYVDRRKPFPFLWKHDGWKFSSFWSRTSWYLLEPYPINEPFLETW